jgi:hypothetical protein
MESLAAAASNNVSGADDKDIAAASLKGNAFTSTKWRELCKLPAFNKLILKAVDIQTTAGDRPALNFLLKNRVTFTALQIPIPASTASQNTTLQFVEKMRDAYEELFFDESTQHHEGLLDRAVSSAPAYLPRRTQAHVV